MHLVAGAVAGAAGALVSNPMDVAKTRYQTLDASVEADARQLR